MAVHHVAAAGDHLRRLIGSNAMLGLAELVWNALDANANKVDVAIHRQAAGGVDEVVVTDNGHGFSAAQVEDLFGAVGGSWKALSDGKSEGGLRLLHGRKGEGRWKAFAVGDRVTWESVTAAHERVRVTISAEALDQYEDTDPQPAPAAEPGTIVRVIAGMREPRALIADDAHTKFSSILVLYLTKYPDVEITFDGRPVDVADSIDQSAEFRLEIPNEFGPVHMRVIEWKQEVPRAIYLCDVDGATLQQIPAGIQAPGFNFTAYISWAGFRVHESTLLVDDWHDDLQQVIEPAREELRRYFAQRLEETQQSVVEAWQGEHVYPYEEAPRDDVEQAKQALFNYVAVTAAPAVNRIADHTAKRLSLGAIRVAVEQDPSSLHMIMTEVMKLPPEKVDEFRRLIDRNTLVGFISAIKKITGRLEMVMALEHLVYDTEVAPEVLERAHLQKIIEGEPWLFGEEFATHVSDKSLSATLKAHIGILGRDELNLEPVLDHAGKVRRVDFLFGRALEHARNKRDHLVVEIKRPTVPITRKEIAQIEDYAAAVAKDGRFDRTNVEWDFVLVSTTIDSHAENRGSQNGWPNGLIQMSPVRIWVKTWAEIISECRHRLKFVRDQLHYDPDADQAIGYLRENYPQYLPDQVHPATQ